MISFDHVSVVFPRTSRTDAVVALDDVSLTVQRGETLGIIGPSGSGKTTLGRCLTGLQQPTAGTITLDGQTLSTLKGRDLRDARRRVGVIFQQFNLLDSRTALSNVTLPLELAGVGKRERSQRGLELLERVGLAAKANAHPSELSGGQRQRVAIARALATRPQVLVSDEATSALDPASTNQVLDLIGSLTHELGLTTILITHEPDVVRRACDRVAVLSEGHLAHVGAVEQILTAVHA